MSDANLLYSCKKTELVKLFLFCYIFVVECASLCFCWQSYPFNVACIAAFMKNIIKNRVVMDS